MWFLILIYGGRKIESGIAIGNAIGKETTGET
jgi:hypothetical protein